MLPVGNRGHELYTCGSNVLLQSIYTIGVAGSEYDGRISDYSEYCGSVMVTAYSSYGLNDEFMTVRHNVCALRLRDRYNAYFNYALASSE